METMQQLTDPFIAMIPRFLAGIAVFAGFVVANLILGFLLRRMQREGTQRYQAMRLVHQLLAITLLSFGMVTALGTMGVNVSALVAGLGLTGFALGYALKDAISNMLAGILLILYRPFRINDHISVAGFEGVVKDVNFRYTALEWEEKRFLIPNSMLFTNPVALITAKRQEPVGAGSR